jgi:16S rRNA (cytosine967-C5)-methyltransferase
VVQSRADEAEVLSKLTAAGATVSASTIAAGAWRVSGATALLRELTAAGEIYLQDEGSQLVAQVLAVEKGERVLDLCAAPGGKTTQIADRAAGEAFVIAADRSAARMAAVVEATRLQGLKGIQTVLLDAAERLPFEPGTFDRGLVDAPCSGTGTLRRNPEIRWRLTANDIPALAQAQKKILKSAMEMIKPGGCLVYSTCSVECEENEEVVQEVIGAGDRLRLFRTWPQQEGCDGFFIAAFAKAK